MNEKFEIQNCIGGRLGRIKRVIDNIYRKYLSPLGVTESQTMILLYLSKFGEVPQIEIAKALVLEKSSLSRNLIRLEKMEIIFKTKDYHPQIALTEKGKKFMKVLDLAWQKAMEESKNLIGEDGWEAIAILNEKA